MDRSAGLPLKVAMLVGLAVAVVLGALALRGGDGPVLRADPAPEVLRDTANPVGEVPLIFPLHPGQGSGTAWRGPEQPWDATAEAVALGHTYRSLSVEVIRRPARLAVTVDGTRHEVRLPAGASHELIAVLLPGRDGPGIVGRLRIEEDDPVRHWWWVGWVGGEPRLLERPRLYSGPADGFDPRSGFRATVVVNVLGDLFSLIPREPPQEGPVRTHVNQWLQRGSALDGQWLGEFCIDARTEEISPTVASRC